MYNLSTDSSDVFRVPDLRGEFLRGAGTNSHTNQGSGGTVGTHQDSTTIAYMMVQGGNNVHFETLPNSNMVQNADSTYNMSGYSANLSTATMSTNTPLSTLRPTNTSVNWIIKY